MTKDAVAGRIRRLLAMADKRAAGPRASRTPSPSLTADMLAGAADRRVPRVLGRDRRCVGDRVAIRVVRGAAIRLHRGEHHVTVRVGINGFGRIGRNFFRACSAPAAPTSRSWRSTTSPTPDAGPPAEVRQRPGQARRGRVGRRRHHHGRRPDDQGAGRARPGRAALGRPGRRHRHRVDRLLHQGRRRAASTSTAAPRRSSSPRPATDEDLTVVMGVNDDTYDPAQHNDHLQRVLHHELPGADGQGAATTSFGIVKGLMTTIHAYTTRPEPAGRPAQGPAPGPRRGAEHRPHLHRRRQGHRRWCCPSSRASWTATRCACRCPTGSVTDLTVELAREVTKDEVNAAYQGRRRGPAQGHPVLHRGPDRLQRHRRPPASCTFDASITMAYGNQVKVFGWYDNEWGYSNRLVDLTSSPASGYGYG